MPVKYRNKLPGESGWRNVEIPSNFCYWHTLFTSGEDIEIKHPAK
jgi:hypothetical protein